jgi:hypothetical protein
MRLAISLTVSARGLGWRVPRWRDSHNNCSSIAYFSPFPPQFASSLSDILLSFWHFAFSLAALQSPWQSTYFIKVIF